MMMATYSRHDVRARENSRDRVAAAVLLAAALLTWIAWTDDAWAQAKPARVGILTFSAATEDPTLDAVLQAFREALARQGWIEGKNVSFAYRNADNDPSKLASAAAELVQLEVDAIFASNAPALRAAYAATRTIPIVANDFTTDPVAEGYVQTYARPGKNVTGVFLNAPGFAGKWFELLTAMIPDLKRVSVLWDPGPGTTHLKAVRDAANLLDIKVQVLEVRTPEDIDTAFSGLRGYPQALIFLPSPMIYGQSARLARLSLKYRMPATSMAREFATAGGTLSYGPERESSWGRCAAVLAKVLNGSKPSAIPVEQPAKIQLVVNRKTADALGISIPQSILLRADEVIQ